MKSQLTAQAVKQRVDRQSTDTVLQYLAGDQCDASVRQYIDAVLADNTLRAYRADLQHFITWGGVIPVTPERAAAAGFDARLFSGHSLRAGFVTNAANGGASSASIRAQTGHKSDAMMQRYIRNSHLFSNNPNLKIW